MSKLITIGNTNSAEKIDINGEILEIIPLGSGSEVGRSCIILKFQGKNIMLDCGIHPAYVGLGSLPYFDEIDPSKIDLLLITHFHLDHCGALPYFLEKTGFDGDCYMTHPTKAIYKLILADYVKVSHVNTEEALYEERDLIKSLDKIKLIDYHQEINVKDVKFWAYNAGHVLGAAMFLVEIQGIRILYTGDFSRELDRHLKPAEIPNYDVHILVVESTYGIHKHEPRDARENDFTRYVSEIVRRGGKCLLPVFAVGRAQELLLILDEFWEMNGKMSDVEIYYASSLASNSIEIFKTYINMSGEYVRKKFYDEGVNPFNFKHIKCVKTIEDLDENKPAVVFASPGMLQSGLSRNLFEKWCQESKNGIVITGYCVEGTLARYLLGEPSEITLSNGKNVPLRMTVKNVTFSAHSDFAHTSEFIEILQPRNIVLIHGDGKEMERLKNEYERLKMENNHYKSFKPKIFNPKNCQRIEFRFKIQKHSYIVGHLSEKITEIISNPLNGRITNSSMLCDNNILEDDLKANTKTYDDKEDDFEENYIECTGILLERENLLIDKRDLSLFSSLQSNKFKQILSIKYTNCKDALWNILIDYFKNISQIGINIFLVDNSVKLYINDNNVVLEWHASGYNDYLSNSIAMLVYQLENFPNDEMFLHYMSKEKMCSYKKKNLITFLKVKYPIVADQGNSIVVQDEEPGNVCEIIDFDKCILNSANSQMLEKVKADLEFFAML